MKKHKKHAFVLFAVQGLGMPYRYSYVYKCSDMYIGMRARGAQVEQELLWTLQGASELWLYV